MPVTLDLDNAAGEPSTRRTLSSLSLSVAKCKKIVVVTGAGISCSCGIPDFRSSDGLYALVKKQYPDVVLKGRDLFDASLFRDSTSTAVFYTFISQLKQSVDKASPSPTHKFLKTLDSKRKLLRSYTQNIDGLEERAGLLGSSSQDVKVTGKGKAKIKAKEVRNVQLHGDIHRVRCTFCSAEFPCTKEYMDAFDSGDAPDCPECTTRSAARQARSARALRIGTLRPAIVLYDEPHPLGDEIGAIQSTDLTRRPDMLIIMGTSLKVHGFKKLVKEFARTVHESAPPVCSPSKSPNPKAPTKSHAGKVVFVNKTAPGSEWDGIIDFHVAGETDKWCERVIEDWKKMRPADWEVQKTLDAQEGFKAMKDVTNAAAGKPKSSAKENKPPSDEKDKPSKPRSSIDLTTLTPPPSPSKRRKSDCHYSDSECSPSKKRASREIDLSDFECGPLFGDTTNKPVKDVKDDDDVFAGPVEAVPPPVPVKSKTRNRSVGTAVKSKSKVEVTVQGKTGRGRTIKRATSSRTVPIR